ncbi:hypothetical protein ABPG75_010283 [Micractinium tetrahymenae]
MASPRAVCLLLLLLLGAAIASAKKACPGGAYARTPDKFAPCRCGYRPGPGGGDCKQYQNNWCYPYQKKKLRCSSRVSFFEVDTGSGPKPQYSVLRTYCDKGFRCVDRGDGPWCCPTKA